MRRFAPLLPGLAGLCLLGAAAPAVPRALAGVAPGLWEVSRSASGQAPERLCLREVVHLASISQRGVRCGRTILADRPGSLLVDVTCPGGDFARSQITVTTPRSLKLQTQGIRRGEPFDLTLYARRVGSCRPIWGAR